MNRTDLCILHLDLQHHSTVLHNCHNLRKASQKLVRKLCRKKIFKRDTKYVKGEKE
jgi:hypothetical protein